MARLPMNSLRREAEIDLDGTWDFRLETAPDSVGEWTAVQVPSLWTMDERFGIPQYLNVAMPFPEGPPALPKVNQVGRYRRSVELDIDEDRRWILHVGAAEGYLTVAVNDASVGTSTDSHLAAEFDVTDYLQSGTNKIELAVAQWSDESYLEDQDQWWQFGLSRSVYLYSVPTVRITDAAAVADFDSETGLGSLELMVSADALAQVAGSTHSVRITFRGQHFDVPVEGQFAQPTLPKMPRNRSEKPRMIFPPDMLDLLSIQAAQAPIPTELRAIPGQFGGGMPMPNSPAGTAVLKLDGLDVAPWSAERPHLELLEIALTDGDGRVVDATSLRLGFRRVEIVGRDLLVNGQRVLIQGVNRHDVDPHTGRVLSRERMRDELSLLKRFNVNAIRCSHYPNDPYLLDLCDEYGLYVVDEADVEAHAFASVVPSDPYYLTAIVERVARMVLRDRNHPSVISWSLGNESGYGAAHDAAAAWVRHFDSTRPVQYEGAVATDWHGGHAASDILSPMYPSFAAMEAYADDARATRPLIACEYAYAQGNGTGGLDHYWDLFETRPGLQGGFIWQFLDHALDRDGDGHFRYGGDFGDEPNSGTTILNGVVFSDLTPKPAFWEARGIFSPVRVASSQADARAGFVAIRSRRWFADLSDVVLAARVETREGATEEVTLDAASIAPAEVRRIELPDEIQTALASDRALALSIVVRLASDEAWAPAGTELAVQQVVLDRPSIELEAVPVLPQVDDRGLVAHPLLAGAPRLCLWRAMTDNDASFTLDSRFVATGFFALEPAEVTVESEGSAKIVRTVFRAAFGDEVHHTRRIEQGAEGEWIFEEHVELPEDTTDGLRVGMEFTLAEGFQDVTWSGLGPWENYPDRQRAALLGTWSSTIDDAAVPYLKPQSNGTRGGVDDALITGPAGSARVRSTGPLHLTVSRHTIDELENTGHWWELAPSGRTVVQLDVAHRGVGTALLGPDTRKPFRLTDRVYEWTWSLLLTEGS